METQHTPGPWRYDYEPGCCGELIAPNGTTLAEFVTEPSEANARLIAAAPDLLEALTACADWLDWLVTPSDDPKGMHAAHIKMARAAIAKATGN